MEPSRPDLLAMGRELQERVSQWTLPGGELMVKDDRVSSSAHAPMVHGLARHTLLSGAAALDLHEADKSLEAMPLSRMAWEFSITAMWLADSKEGAAALHEESRRQHGYLLEGLQHVPGANPYDVAARVSELYGDELETSTKNQARRFHDRCLALEGVGEQGYAVYRAMSTYCHPSMYLIDRYLIPDDSEAGVKLRHMPEPSEAVTAWIHLTIMAMMWGARAFDVMTVDHVHRGYLRQFAHRLGTPVDIARLTPAELQRENAARTQRRRREWKGPRRRGPETERRDS